MKIDAETINHNALRLIAEVTTDMWGDGMDSMAKDAVMYTRGIIEMADALKEVLKV